MAWTARGLARNSGPIRCRTGGCATASARAASTFPAPRSLRRLSCGHSRFFNDYRDSAVYGTGVHAGLASDGRLFIRQRRLIPRRSWPRSLTKWSCGSTSVRAPGVSLLRQARRVARRSAPHRCTRLVAHWRACVCLPLRHRASHSRRSQRAHDVRRHQQTRTGERRHAALLVSQLAPGRLRRARAHRACSGPDPVQHVYRQPRRAEAHRTDDARGGQHARAVAGEARRSVAHHLLRSD